MTKESSSALTLFDDLGASPLGARELAASQLTNDALVLLQTALSSTGVTQKQLAEILGIGESRVSQVVNGEGNLKLATFARYMRALGYAVTVNVTPVERNIPELTRERRKPAITTSKATLINP
jgi:predicted XRE-type DNA-binding protein